MTRTPIGSTRTWIRDLAVIGAACALAPFAVVWETFPFFVAGALVFGALSGALLGAVFPRLLLGPFSRLPIAVMLIVGALIGALWGGAVGAVAGLVEGAFGARESVAMVDVVAVGALCASVAGAVQLGWFWLPYTVRRARGRAAWPVVVAAVALSAGLGWAALAILGALG